MKKKIIIIVLILIILLLIGLKFISFGTTKYKSSVTSATLEIPKLSVFEKECCMFSISFKTFRSKYIIQKELDNIISKYEKRRCNNRNIYYNKKEDVTITEYGVQSGLLYNTFYFIYDKGEYGDQDCAVIGDYQQLKYRIDTRYILDYVYTDYQYKNKDGKLYDVYIDGLGILEIQNGAGVYHDLPSMLLSSWMSMDDLIAFLEYQVENKKATKEAFDDGGSILYKNKDFSLLECNTTNGNKDIYLGSMSFIYKDSYCK